MIFHVIWNMFTLIFKIFIQMEVKILMGGHGPPEWDRCFSGCLQTPVLKFLCLRLWMSCEKPLSLLSPATLMPCGPRFPLRRRARLVFVSPFLGKARRAAHLQFNQNTNGSLTALKWVPAPLGPQPSLECPQVSGRGLCRTTDPARLFAPPPRGKT